MRWAIDSLVALMIAGIVTGVVLHFRTSEEDTEHQTHLREDVARFRQVIVLQAAFDQVPMSARGFPLNVDPEWFAKDEQGMPENLLLDEQHPWLEIAGPAQAELSHPTQRVATNSQHAKFWYNPYTGDVRARVPAGVSDAESLALYNDVNACSLTSLFEPAKTDDE